MVYLPPILFATLDFEQQNQLQIIYEKHGQKMYHAALYYTKNNQQLAMDIVQDAFIKIMASIDKNNSASSEIQTDNNFSDLCSRPANYFVLIVRSVFLDYTRKQKKEKENLNPTSWEGLLYEGKDIETFTGIQDFNTPEEILLSKENTERLLDYIRNMSEKYREPLLLKLVHQLSEKEIAELLGISQKTVNSQIYRGRQMLIEAIEKEVRE